MSYVKTFIITLAIVLLISIISCNGDSKQKGSQVQQIPVVSAIKFDVPIISSYVGQIYGQKDIPIRARVEGFLETVDFVEGSKVEKGQLLYTIDPQSLAAATNAQKSEVVAAQTALTKAKSDLNRIKPLAEANAVSKSELDESQANYDAAMANLKVAKSNLKSSNIELSYTKVLSPISGLIGKTNARVGEFVGRDPNPVILNTVSAIDTIIVKFALTETQYLQIAKQYIERVEAGEIMNGKHRRDVELQLSDESIYNKKGIVDFIDRNIDEATGSILVQASFANPNNLLRPGMYSKIRIKTGNIKGAIVIPQRCIMELQGSYSVYIVTDSNTIIQQPVKIGYKDGDLAAISKGLTPDDRIVIDAIQKVRNGMKIIPMDTVFNSAVFEEYNKAMSK